MLRTVLPEALHSRKDEIVGYMSSINGKRVRGVVFKTIVEYQYGQNIYFSPKGQYRTELEAFVTLWTHSLIDAEEWQNYYEYNPDFALPVFENFFIKEIEKYNYPATQIDIAVRYVKDRIETTMGNIGYNRKRYPLLSMDHTLPDFMPGIYVDGKIVDENSFVMCDFENILSVEELWRYEEYSGYSEIFLESDEDYIYYSD